MAAQPLKIYEDDNKILQCLQAYLQVNSKKLKDDTEVPFIAEMVKASHNMILISPITYIIQLQEQSHDQIIFYK